MTVTFYMDGEITRTQTTDALPRVGDYLRWRTLSGFWLVTAVVHTFDISGGTDRPEYYVYTKLKREIRRVQ